MVTCINQSCSQEVEVALHGGLCLYVECVLADFVRVLARSRNFDTSTPVEVEVAELIGELLEDGAVDIRGIVAHEEVGGQDAALGGSLTDQEEIVERARFVADQVAIDNSTARRVLDGDCAAT